MPSRRVRPPKSKKNSPIIDGAKFIKRFQPKLIYDQRGLLYQDLPIGCVRTLKGGRLYQEILREKNSQYYGGAGIIKTAGGLLISLGPSQGSKLARLDPLHGTSRLNKDTRS